MFFFHYQFVKIPKYFRLLEFHQGILFKLLIARTIAKTKFKFRPIFITFKFKFSDKITFNFNA